MPRHTTSRRSAIALASLLGLTSAIGAAAAVQAQAPRKRLLVIGEEKGYRHEAVTHAMVTIERLGKETGLWDTVIRTDTEALTKKKLGWAKMYGQGRVFYSTLGHVEANWDKPEMQTMIAEAIRWVLKLVDADVSPRALPR